MTAIAEIIGQAMIYIDDVRLQEQLEINPALFYRRISAYVSAAMPLLTSPPELYCHISKEFVEPEYADYMWKSTEQSVREGAVLETGCIGYDICSVVVRADEGMDYVPCHDFEYDSETGTVTLPLQREANMEYEFDFYKDGELNDLTPHMIRLFALAVAIVWDERFSRSWLNITPKIKDSIFSTINEANYMDKLTIRMQANRKMFEDELHKYEQLNAYRNVNRPYPFKKLI